MFIMVCYSTPRDDDGYGNLAICAVRIRLDSSTREQGLTLTHARAFLKSGFPMESLSVWNHMLLLLQINVITESVVGLRRMIHERERERPRPIHLVLWKGEIQVSNI